MAERRYTTIFAIAVLTAGVATFGIYRVLQAAKAKNKIQTQPVVVAAADLSRFERYPLEQGMRFTPPTGRHTVKRDRVSQP